MSFILLPTVMGFAGALSAVVFGGIGGGGGGDSGGGGSFIFVLDWVLLRRAFIVWVKLSPCPNFFGAGGIKSGAGRSGALRKLSDIIKLFGNS